MIKKKTIAMITINRSGVWVDNLESLQFERTFQVRSGAWVGQMSYEKTDGRWKPIGVIITHGSALTLPSKDWELLPKFITSGEGLIGVRDLQAVKKISSNALKRREWSEKIKESMGSRDFAEFDNFLAFRAPKDIFIHPSIMKNRNGDVVAFALTFGEGVEWP